MILSSLKIKHSGSVSFKCKNSRFINNATFNKCSLILVFAYKRHATKNVLLIQFHSNYKACPLEVFWYHPVVNNKECYTISEFCLSLCITWPVITFSPGYGVRTINVMSYVYHSCIQVRGTEMCFTALVDISFDEVVMYKVSMELWDSQGGYGIQITQYSNPW